MDSSEITSSEAELAQPNGETDQTVISSTTPSPIESVQVGLHPRELGRVLVGQHLDDLFLEEFVGGGGMGAVFRANDNKLNRKVAVKVLSTFYANDQGVSKRFQIEAQSAARLDHPNIARVHSVGEDRGIPYIVFEYIEGTNLRDLINGQGPLPLADAIEYTLQIADALAHAWQRAVVHRDIKPSNILVTAGRQAKLVDMGLARFQQVDQVDADLTATGMTIGTFDYISPEQARNPKEADTRSDIYSLGCTLFYMLTGKPPFSGGTALQKLLQHQGELPPTLGQFRDNVPQSISLLLQKMLAKNIGERYQSPAELLEALINVADGLGISHSSIAVPTYIIPNEERTNAFSQHARWAVPVAILICSIVGYELIAGADRKEAGFESEPLIQVEEDFNSENLNLSVGGSAEIIPDISELNATETVFSEEGLQDVTVPAGTGDAVGLVPSDQPPIPADLAEESTPPFPTTPGGGMHLPVSPETSAPQPE